MTRTPCGHKPTRRAELIGYLADGSQWALCGRAACEAAYNGTNGASHFRGAKALRSAFEVGAPNDGELGETAATRADVLDAPLPLQSEMFGRRDAA